MDDISDFELAMLICFLVAAVLAIVGMWIALERQERRSPVGRLAPRRWLGV
jgi:hypothetical protein